MSQLIVNTTWHDQARSRVEAVKACHEDYNPEKLLDLVQTYLTYESKRGAATSKRTRDTYATGVKDWLVWTRANGTHLLRVEKRDVQLYLAELSQRVSPGTGATYLSSVRTFYRALIWAGAVSKDPAEGVRAPVDPRAKHEKRDAVPLEGYKRMLELARCERDVLLLRVMGDCGLRISEVAALDLADTTGGIIRIKIAKGGKSRKVPMTAGCAEALRAWLRVRVAPSGGEQALFVNFGGFTKSTLIGRRMSADTIRALVKGLIKEVGLPDNLSPHSLRHTALTRIWRTTNDLNVTARIAGHSSVDTTAIYCHMGLDDLRNVMDRLAD